MIKCLVTGGCGFIGSNLVHALLDKGWQVDVVDDLSNGHIEFLEDLDVRTVHVDLLHMFEKKYESSLVSPVLLITGDFAHSNVLSRIKQKHYTYVFHLAAQPRVETSVDEPVMTSETNLFKALALFDACRDSIKRLIFSSSSSIFGDALKFPTDEGHIKNPQSPYALQKYCCEMFATMFYKLYGLDTVSLRYFNVYGPRQYGDSPYATAIAAWCNAIKKNQPLRSDGDGTQCRDLVYVDDVVSANILAATATSTISGMSFNIGHGQSYSNNEILKMFKDRFSNIRITTSPWRSGDVMKTCADVELAHKLLSYKSKMSIEEGLMRTLSWWGIGEKDA